MAFGDLVQSRIADGDSLAYNSDVTEGNLLVAMCHSVTGATLNSVSDTRGNNWQLLEHRDNGSTAALWTFYAYSESTGANTLTIDLSTAVLNHYQFEYEGPFATGDPLVDTSSQYSPATTLGFTGTVTTTRANPSFWWAAHINDAENMTGESGASWVIDADEFGTGAWILVQSFVSSSVTSGNPVCSTAGSTNFWGAAGIFNSETGLTAAGGTYTITGSDAGLNSGLFLVAESGSYVITGQSAGLSATRRIPGMRLLSASSFYDMRTEVFPV